MAWPAILALVQGVMGQAESENAKQTAGIQGAQNAVTRRLGALQQDPMNVLQAGKAQLNSLPEEERLAVSPVLDEAIKKAAMQK